MERVKAEAALSRASSAYCPSVDNFDENDPDKYKYRPLQKANLAVRTQVKHDLESIAALCQRRIIRPKDDGEYKRLREAELVHAERSTPQNGSLYAAAKLRKLDTGKGDVAEYADLVSVVADGARQMDQARNDEDDFATHPHQPLETVLYQLPHDLRANCAAFVNDELFSMRLVMRRSESWCALTQMSQFDSCEQEISKLKDYAPLKMTKKFGEFVTHFGNECGLRLFCTYVCSASPDVVFAAFEMDALQRYFCTMVFTPASGESAVESARAWRSQFALQLIGS